MCDTNKENHNEVLEKVKEYIGQTKFAVLGTVTNDSKPAIRTIGSFVNDGLKVYFSTGKNAAKVGQIKENSAVTLLFQHEGQELSTFKNVTFVGKAKKIDCEIGLAKAIQLLSDKSPRFKAKAENGELDATAIFKVEPEAIRYLDYSNGIGPSSISEISL